MARNPHLFTVHHSLEREGVFDSPSAANPTGGKYYQAPTEWPKYVHRKDHPSTVVADAQEEAQVLASWDAQDALKASNKMISDKNEADPDIREALLEKAKKFGLKVDGRTSDKKLAFLVEEAETAA